MGFNSGFKGLNDNKGISINQLKLKGAWEISWYRWVSRRQYKGEI